MGLGPTPTSQPLELEHVVTRSFSSALTDKSYTPYLSLQGLLISLGAFPHYNCSYSNSSCQHGNYRTGTTGTSISGTAKFTTLVPFSFIQLIQLHPTPDNTEDEQLDPLVSALSFLTAPGKVPEPYFLCMYQHQLRKESGQYVNLAYLLETQLLPDDDKAYKFSCSNSNTNKLSLTMAKPKAKVDCYNSWNKAFRVLTEIVSLKWPDQCLPVAQYTAEISSNIGKFTFVATYNYDIWFRLKKQMRLALKWNEINNSLWTKCFSSSGRHGYHPSASSSTAFKKNDRTDHKTCHDFNFSRCTRSIDLQIPIQMQQMLQVCSQPKGIFLTAVSRGTCTGCNLTSQCSVQ